MKRLPIVTIALMLLMAGSAQGADSGEVYRALLAQAQAGKAVDWQALRFAYADSMTPDFTLNEVRRAMFAAMNSGEVEKALAHAKEIIAKSYIDGEAHLIASAALGRMNRPEEAEAELAIARGLFGSIETGDGSTPRQAFTVVSVDEEYQVLRSKGLRLKSQALDRADGHTFDVMTAIDPQGQTRVIYFQIDRVMAAEMRAFGFGKK